VVRTRSRVSKPLYKEPSGRLEGASSRMDTTVATVEGFSCECSMFVHCTFLLPAAVVSMIFSTVGTGIGTKYKCSCSVC
jgi:hypothetical protein